MHCKYFTFLLQFLDVLNTAHRHHITRGELKVMPPTLLLTNRWQHWWTTGWDMFYTICSFTSVGTHVIEHVAPDTWKAISAFVIRVKQSNKGYLTHSKLDCDYTQAVTGQRNTSVSALIARRLWKCFKLPRQGPLWYVSASRRWMISLPGVLWGCIGSLVMQEWEEMRPLTGSQGAVLVSCSLGQNPFWGSLGRI